MDLITKLEHNLENYRHELQGWSSNTLSYQFIRGKIEALEELLKEDTLSACCDATITQTGLCSDCKEHT